MRFVHILTSNLNRKRAQSMVLVSGTNVPYTHKLFSQASPYYLRQQTVVL